MKPLSKSNESARPVIAEAKRRTDPLAFHDGGLLAAVMVVEDVPPEHRDSMNRNRDELVKLLSIVSHKIPDDDPYEFERIAAIVGKLAKTKVLPPEPEWWPGTGTKKLPTGTLLATVAGLPPETRFKGAVDGLHARLREAQSAARKCLSDDDVMSYTATVMVGRVEFDAEIGVPYDVLRVVSVEFGPWAEDEEKPHVPVRQASAPDWTTPQWDASEFSYEYTEMNVRFLNAFLEKPANDPTRTKWDAVIAKLGKDPIEKSNLYFEHRYSR
ncbi:hypothetical protein ACPZ19_40920 [Amycolatopsis lurida]